MAQSEFRELMILRHAKSSWSEPSLSDHDRPLNSRGLRDAPRMGLFIRASRLIPDVIISSSARRAHETATAVASVAGYMGEIQVMRLLYHSRPATFLDLAGRLPQGVTRALMVGHNPSIEDLVTLLAGTYQSMPTCALALFRFATPGWESLGDRPRASLVGIWRPKELPDID